MVSALTHKARGPGLSPGFSLSILQLVNGGHFSENKIFNITLLSDHNNKKYPFINGHSRVLKHASIGYNNYRVYGF